MTPDKILAAIDAAFTSSPAPPTSGDLAAAVLRSLAEDQGSWTDEDLLELADQLGGALSQGEQRSTITDAELQDRFRAWWQQSYPTPPGPHAVMTHVSWARHLLELDKQRQS